MTPSGDLQRADELRDLWFGSVDADGLPSEAHRERWFRASPEFDRELERSFGTLCERAIAGELQDWEPAANARVALVLLLDQLPRNLYRGTDRAFAGDARALDLARDAIASGIDRRVEPIERVFLYLPFEHSESLQDQNESVRLFDELRSDVSPAARPFFDAYYDYALQHRDCIQRFDRFPHRNECLGRATTAGEREYLASGGGFG